MNARLPSWLISSFVRSVTNIGAQAPAHSIEALAIKLIGKLENRSSQYHNVNYLSFVLNKIDELADSAHSSDCLRIATWYYGVFYNSYLGGFCPALSNENPSDLLKDDLLSVGVDEEICQHICTIVDGARSNSVSNSDDIDIQILFDCSISVFATTPQEYKHYLKLAQTEYSDVSMCFVLYTRKRFIKRLLARPKLFLSPLGQSWEIPARQNLEAELVRLEAEIANIPTQDILALEQAENDTDSPECTLKDTVMIRRVSVADKLSKVKHSVSSVPTSLTNSLSFNNSNSNTQSITKINDLSSSMEMIEDCFDSKETPVDKSVKEIEFE